MPFLLYSVRGRLLPALAFSLLYSQSTLTHTPIFLSLFVALPLLHICVTLFTVLVMNPRIFQFTLLGSLLLAFVLLVLASLSVPIIKSISFLDASSDKATFTSACLRGFSPGTLRRSR